MAVAIKQDEVEETEIKSLVETVVMEGEISGIVPGVKERKVLCLMLAEGDPTNGLPDRGQDRTADNDA